MSDFNFGDMIEHMDGFSSSESVEPGSPEVEAERKSLSINARINHKITIPSYLNNRVPETITVYMYPSEKVIQIFEDKMKHYNTTKPKGKKHFDIDIFEAAHMLFVESLNADDISDELKSPFNIVSNSFNYPYTSKEQLYYFKTIPGVLVFKRYSMTSYSRANQLIDKKYVFPEYNTGAKCIRWHFTNICPWCGDEEHDMRVFNDNKLSNNHSKELHDKYYNKKATAGKISGLKKVKGKKSSGNKKKASPSKRKANSSKRKTSGSKRKASNKKK